MGKVSSYSDLLLKYKLESEFLSDNNFEVTVDGRVYDRNCKDISYLSETPKRYVIRYKSIAMNLYVDRLVYRKFICFDIPLYSTVSHKDGNIKNNLADNLFLIQKENTTHSIENLLEDDIRWIRDYGIWDECAPRMSKAFNLTRGQIRDIVTGVARPEAGGLIISPKEFDDLVSRRLKIH